MPSGDPIIDGLAASFQRGAASAGSVMGTTATTIASIKIRPHSTSVSSPFGPRLGSTRPGCPRMQAKPAQDRHFEPPEVEVVEDTNPRAKLSEDEKRRRKKRRKATKKSKRRNRR